MDEHLRKTILALCNMVEEVTANGDWPNEDEADVWVYVEEIRTALGEL